jgi:hypothetical protein
MTFSSASEQFGVRFKIWAMSEWENEIANSFPRLRLFRSGAAWEMYTYMQMLSRSERLVLARCLVSPEECSFDDRKLLSKYKVFFRVREFYYLIQRLEKDGQVEQAHAIYQAIRLDVEKLLDQPPPDDWRRGWRNLEDIFAPIPTPLNEQIERQRLAGEKIKFASRQLLRKAIIAKFKSTFECYRTSPTFYVGGPEPHFEFKSCGWILSTDLSIPCNGCAIEYSHTIASENMFELKDSRRIASAWVAVRSDISANPPLIYRSGYLTIARNVSLLTWLGIASESEWEYIFGENIEQVCESVIRFCDHFFKVAPKLLKGLDGGTITSAD